MYYFRESKSFYSTFFKNDNHFQLYSTGNGLKEKKKIEWIKVLKIYNFTELIIEVDMAKWKFNYS